jgi:anaerobic magnesium-protoporphyrin IX monomethyl ester cyclase
MTDVLLANSYFLSFDQKQQQKMRPYMPLATLYVAAQLRAAGYSVELFDAMLAASEDDFESALRMHRPAVVVMYEDNFNYLSKMCLGRMREAALTMIAMAADSGARIVVAGSDASDHPEPFLDAGAHFVAVGEGDHTVGELVAWWLRRPTEFEPVHIDGLVFRGGAGLVRTESRRNERRPDVFAFPARDLVDVDAYRDAWVAQHGYFSVNLVSTRGCPFHCNWCAKPIWGQRYAMRSPGDVATELAEVKHTIRPDHVWFADDIFGLRPSWLAEFGREVTTRQAHIPFTIQSRCDLMTEVAVAGLAEAGCAEVWLGAESGSQKVLDAMDKGIDVEEIRVARARLGEAGIRACFFIQFGYPGERWDDIRATIELVRETLPDDIGVSVSYPLPGTRFHQMVQEQLGDKTHWDDSGDLAMMFRGTYTTPFYRHLHATLHDDLDLHRRRAGLPPTPRHEPTDLERHEARVAEAWSELAELERSCRSSRPTLLVRTAAPPTAPDLSKPWN